jgi:tRNA G37 N-methylase Trm5
MISNIAKNGTALTFVIAATLTLGLTCAVVAQDPKVLYFPTPQAAVEKMLEMAEIKSDDVLIDLGSGDGRIPITAAKTYGIRAYGVDIDAALIETSNDNAEHEGVSGKVTFKQQDLFETDLGNATIITMFLLTSINDELRPRLQKLKPGTRVLSYSFGMSDWKPDRIERVDGRAIYLWVVR